MNVNLLPYGNARTAPDGSVQCQHGDRECKANIWQSCAISLFPEFTAHYPFVKCMEDSFVSQLDNAASFAASSGPDLATLKACATGPLGEQFHRDIGAKTGTHAYVPWVIVDGKQVADESQFIRAVCDAYKGENAFAPPACRSILPPLKPEAFGHFNYNEEYLLNNPMSDVVLQHFEEFASFFDKVYESVEAKTTAQRNFYDSLVRVAQNSNPTHGVTKFSDMSATEFAATYLNRQPRSSLEIANTPMWDGECTACNRFPEHAEPANVDTLDWVAKGAVVSPKDQGQCGSCWAFGTIGDIEGTNFLAGNPLTSLSEQQIVSCDTKYGDQGCNGGLPEQAFKYVIAAGGVVTEKAYPYASGSGRAPKCNTAAEAGAKSASISSWVQVSKTASGESAIQTALVQSGPLVIGIYAEPMQDYVKGIDNPSCPSSARSLDHAVVIVGYGTENGVDYWKIKNSWSTSWGEKGYYRIVKGKNKCGLAMDVTHSVAKKKSEVLRGSWDI
jgi:C1A family cysteine protease